MLNITFTIALPILLAAWLAVIAAFAVVMLGKELTLMKIFVGLAAALLLFASYIKPIAFPDLALSLIVVLVVAGIYYFARWNGHRT